MTVGEMSTTGAANIWRKASTFSYSALENVRRVRVVGLSDNLQDVVHLAETKVWHRGHRSRDDNGSDNRR